MKTYLSPTRRFACEQTEIIFAGGSIQSALMTLGQIRIELVNFHHNVLDWRWGTQGAVESDYRHHIHFVCSGSAELVYEGEAVLLKPGFAYWVPSSVPVARRCDARFEEYILTFYCELIDGVDLFSDWAQRRPLCVGAWDMKGLQADWAQRPLPLNTLMRLQGLLFQFIAAGADNLEEIAAHHALVFARYAEVFAFVEKHLAGELRVATLAKVYGTSASAFAMAFGRHLGMSPKAYLNRKLNQKACQLVTQTDWTVKAMARELGFADEFYFSRFFLKMNGVSPSGYRKGFYL